MLPVKSSNIAEIGYEANELRVQFTTSTYVYVYPGVTEETYQTILVAPSIGSAFHHLVKKVVPPSLVRKERTRAEVN